MAVPDRAPAKAAAEEPPRPVDHGWYFLSTGLLYPGALGAAINWSAEGAFHYMNALRTQQENKATGLAFAAALWATTYHAFWFVRLLKNVPKEKYYSRRLIADVLDCIVLLMVFGAVRFSEMRLVASDTNSFVLFYFAVIGLAVAVGIHHKMEMTDVRTVLTTLALLVAIAGLVAGQIGAGRSVNIPLVFCLWVLLLFYMVAAYMGWLKEPST